jgi:hypothetical protein
LALETKRFWLPADGNRFFYVGEVNLFSREAPPTSEIFPEFRKPPVVESMGAGRLLRIKFVVETASCQEIRLLFASFTICFDEPLLFLIHLADLFP